MSVIYYERETLVPEGTTAFLVKSVEERVSQSGGKYLRLKGKDLVSGGTFVENVSLGSTSTWKVVALCDSLGLVLPDGGFELNSSDLENRVGYATIKHGESAKSDKVFADVQRFHTRAQALELNPALADVEIPTDALTEPEELRPARVRRTA